MSPPEAICFDLDSTLCLSTQSDHDIHTAVFDRAGIDPLFAPSDVRAVDSTELDAAESDTEFYANLYRAATRQSTGRDVEDSLLTTLAEITTDVVDETAVQFRGGADSALAYAREQYDEVGLITNGGEQTQTAKLETLGIDGTFDVTVFCAPSEGVNPKPATEPFEMALSGLDARPKQTVYVGDTHSSDVVGAHRASLQSVWAPVDRAHEQLPSNPEPTPTYRLDSMGDLPSVL
jgi:FMN phosphatase YigB (HAD superfamily)